MPVAYSSAVASKMEPCRGSEITARITSRRALAEVMISCSANCALRRETAASVSLLAQVLIEMEGTPASLSFVPCSSHRLPEPDPVYALAPTAYSEKDGWWLTRDLLAARRSGLLRWNTPSRSGRSDNEQTRSTSAGSTSDTDRRPSFRRERRRPAVAAVGSNQRSRRPR